VGKGSLARIAGPPGLSPGETPSLRIRAGALNGEGGFADVFMGLNSG